MDDDFYIGWQATAPKASARRMRRFVLGLIAATLLSGACFALAQRTIGNSVFEWGRTREFSGVLRAAPYPHLLVRRPGAESNAYSSYYLVRAFKFGLDPDAAARFNGRAVTLRGTLIFRGDQTMIEVVSGSLKLDPGARDAPPAAVSQLGRQTLVGEIVDSKCYLGVMNPGRLAPHRACAIRCISGGIPPVLLVRGDGGVARYFVLVSPDGKAVNQAVLKFVAEPVRITGEVERHGEMFVLRADPKAIQRL